MSQITDPDVQILARCSVTLQADYAPEDLEWTASPFAWIKSRPSRQRGVIGEKLVAGWLATKGFDVTRSPDAQADRLINDRRAEIKFSTLWKSGFYKFQQLRDQNYEFVVCLGVSPFDAHAWAIPKSVILERWRNADGVASQHTGRTGTDTAWLSVHPGREPPWLNQWGGRLQRVASAVAQITGRNPV